MLALYSYETCSMNMSSINTTVQFLALQLGAYGPKTE